MNMSSTISVRQAAPLLQVCANTVIAMIRRGELAAHKRTLARNSGWRIDRQDLETYLRLRALRSQP